MVEWKKVEAALFASGKYMSEDQLAEMSGLSKKKVNEALNEIKKHYDKSDTSLGLFNEGDEWKLNVKEEYNSVVRNVISEAEMPKHIMETLAIIAYKSPVLQSEIKKMRGIASYDHIKILMDKGFITREKYGRSFKIKITDKFNEYFDLDDEKLAEMFKDIKKPDPEKIGNLEVYNSKEENNGDDLFDQQILDRMKKIETSAEDNENNHKFLNEMEEKIRSAKGRIDEAEEEMSQYRRTESKNGEESNSTQNPDEERKPVDKKNIFGDQHDEYEENDADDSEEESDDETDIEKTSDKTRIDKRSTQTTDMQNADEPESESDKILRKVSKEVKDLTEKTDE